VQAVATMLTIASLYRYDAPEVKQIDAAVHKRVWEFPKEIEQLNRYAVEYLEAKRGGVLIFGKVRRINAAMRRKLWVDLTGRGHTVAVTIPTNQPAPKLEVGDGIALFGFCIGTAPESMQLHREVPHILAGLLTTVTLPSVPEDTALQAAYDLGRHNRRDQGFEENVRKFVDTFPRVIPLIGKAGIRWQKIELNTRGRQLDAVRFSVPPELEADVLWSFNDPERAIEYWNIMPVADFPIDTDSHHITLKGFTAPGLTRAESSHLELQGLPDGLLVPNEDYLLWFAFRDTQPRRISIAVRLVPIGSFDQKDTASTGAAMRDGVAFKPDMLARMTKALKEKSLTAGAPAPEPAPKETSPPSDDAKNPAAEPPKAEK
jgi:hypothetical protein